MMKLYPALRSQMGSWNNYIVKMSARELSESVKYASEVYEDCTLNQATRRIMNDGPVKKAIAEYLKRQPDRFLSSIVVAAIEGNPMFYPLEIVDDSQLAMFQDDGCLNESLGVLKFDGTQQYYALDGQHRLSAIKALLDRTDPLSDGAPEDFENDEYSVIIIVPGQKDPDFMQKYRRLFSNLNRHAKPTDQATNIIMDEDDTFAILTRRLLTEHDFFKWAGRQSESQRVKTRKGKNLKSTDPYFTSLEALYEINIELLSSVQRKPKGWGPISAEGTDLKSFKRFRPSEDYIEQLYAELTMYWEALLAVIPDLHKAPRLMRVHEMDGMEGEAKTDHLLFWPIGQQMLAEIARDLLDNRLQNPATPNLNAVKSALQGLGRLEWRLHQVPWRYLFLIRKPKDEDPQQNWTMRNETRKEAIRCGRRIQQWIIGVDELDDQGAENLKTLWGSMLIPAQSDEQQNQMWEQVERMKFKTSG